MNIYRIIGVVVVLSLLGLIIGLIIHSHNKEKSKTFLPIKGKIISVDLEEKVNTKTRHTQSGYKKPRTIIVNRRENYVSAGSSSSSSNVVYKPVICIEYDITDLKQKGGADDAEKESEPAKNPNLITICLDHPSEFSSLSNAKTIQNRYKVGDEITFYYNPKDTSEFKFDNKKPNFPIISLIATVSSAFLIILLILFGKFVNSYGSDTIIIN